MTITVTAANKADLLAQVEDLTGGSVTAPDGGGGGGTTPPDQTGDNSKDPNNWSPEKVTAVYFPDDYTLAKFPSPEGSKTVCDPDGTLHGRPYVISAGGAVYLFQKGPDGKPIVVVAAKPPNGHVLTCNNVPASTNGMLDAVVAQGQVYFHVAPGGQTLKTSAVDSPGAGTTVTQIPLFWSDPFFGSHNSGNSGTGGGGSGGGGGVPMPPDPPPPAVKPGSNGTVINFGAGTSFATIAAAMASAKAGDTVSYAASAPRGVTFAESFDIPEGVKLDGGGRWNDPTMAQANAVIDAAIASKDWASLESKLEPLYTPGAILDGKGVTNLAHGLGGAVPNGNTNTIGFRVKNWGMNITQHDGTGGIRARGNMVGQMQGAENFISACQNGIGPGGTQIINGPWDNTVILQCGISDGSGGSHNVYDSSNVVRTIIGKNFISVLYPFPKGDGGHAYKTRASALQFTGPFRFVGSDSSALDIPDGTALQVDMPSGTIEQIAGALNHSLISYAVESQTKGVAGIKASGTTFVASCDNPKIFTQGPVDLTNAVKTGNTITLSGQGPLTGA